MGVSVDFSGAAQPAKTIKIKYQQERDGYRQKSDVYKQERDEIIKRLDQEKIELRKGVASLLEDCRDFGPNGGLQVGSLQGRL